jgi:hypothetical protein
MVPLGRGADHRAYKGMAFAFSHLFGFGFEAAVVCKPSGRSGLAACCAAVWRGAGIVALAWSLNGCDQLGIETPQKAAEHQSADAKAIGSACRHAMRAIEDCYTLNPKADKSAVFGGWREMDEYMRENKLEGIAPVVPRPPPVAASKASAPASSADDAEEDPPEHAAKPAKHAGAKAH